MALDERYFVASDIEQYFVDKDSGLPLAGGTIEFFRDVSRSTPKPVYQLSGSPPNYTYTSMGAVIDLSAVGTVQNSGGDNEVIYYYPYDEDGELDLYYIVVRDSDGVEQFTREAWPNITAADDPTQDNVPIFNQIANPQFTKVFINDGYTTTYSVSAATNEVFAFAPDWDFVISGTGTVDVQRVAIAGNDHVITSPPYVLDITVSGGITACYLRQRLNVNSGLWASTSTQTIFLATTVVARNEGAGTSGIQMFYAESSGNMPLNILDASFDNSGYVELKGVSETAVPISTNTDEGDNGYVDIYLSFLTGSHVRISSIQVTPTTNSAGADIIEYDQNSSNREQALMGDYYIPNLNAKPLPSLLTAWDFPLNPMQIVSSGSLATIAGYICDQTIALRGATGNITYARDSITNGLKFTTAGTDDSFYILQYLSGAQAKKILGTMLSVNFYGFKNAASDDVTMRVYLCRADSGSSIPTLPTSIGTVATDGTFTLTAAGWTLIPRGGLDTAKALLPVLNDNSDLNSADFDIGFTGWQLTDNTQIGDTDKFAIVVTFGYIDSATEVTVNSISLLPNALPARPAPQTFDDVLKECEYYYEKSYELGTALGAMTATNAVTLYAKGDTDNSQADVFPPWLAFRYKRVKRITNANIKFYSIGGTADNVSQEAYTFPTTVLLATADLTITGNYVKNHVGTDAALYTNDPAGTAIFHSAVDNNRIIGYVRFHYTIDARLGVV